MTIEKSARPDTILWGKQTALCLQNFNIGEQCFADDFIDALVTIKRCCAQVNNEQGLLADEHCAAILFACDELLQGKYRDQFPLRVWQTGSGTQTNMNVNEVIATLANAQLATQNMPSKKPVHPNDHVNMSQSSNDVFPTAMHISAAYLSKEKLLLALDHLYKALEDKQAEFQGEYTVGRTHLMDALPMPVGAVLSGYGAQLLQAKSALSDSLNAVYPLAIGGTAVGTGANAPVGFGEKVAQRLASHYQLAFKVNSNAYAAVSGEDGLLRFSGALKQLASVLFKIANDFRMLASGPRCGFNEWHLPANEAGSSIMPGKVNPTQCEALSMVCLQVFGNELTVSLAASHGQLQLNTYRPVIIYNVMQSIDLLSDAMRSFSDNCVRGLKLNKQQIEKNRQNNLSAITLLAPAIGYDVAASIVKEADSKGISLAEASALLALYSQEEFAALLKDALN